jgi:hypothetical protein
MTARMDGAPDSVTHKTQCTKRVLDARIVYFAVKKIACRITRAGDFSDSI